MNNQEFELYDPQGSFAVFVSTMRARIEASTTKHGDFTSWDTKTLIASLWKEFQELNEALVRGNIAEAEVECNDVANLAYMVSNSLRKRGLHG